MASHLQRAIDLLSMFAGRLSARRDNGPINSINEVQRYVSTRSAFIAQKKLYGYLKTRIGTRYPSMFEDDIFVASIKIANYHIFAACVADLTIFALAQAFKGQSVTDRQLTTIGLQIFTASLNDNGPNAPPEFSAPQYIADFEVRLGTTGWRTDALVAENFTQSPKALVHWAPIAPELKQFDTEIVENSIRYAWREMRQLYLKRLDAEAVYADWTASVEN